MISALLLIVITASATNVTMVIATTTPTTPTEVTTTISKSTTTTSELTTKTSKLMTTTSELTTTTSQLMTTQIPTQQNISCGVYDDTYYFTIVSRIKNSSKLHEKKPEWIIQYKDINNYVSFDWINGTYCRTKLGEFNAFEVTCGLWTMPTVLIHINHQLRVVNALNATIIILQVDHILNPYEDYLFSCYNNAWIYSLKVVHADGDSAIIDFEIHKHTYIFNPKETIELSTNDLEPISIPFQKRCEGKCTKVLQPLKECTNYRVCLRLEFYEFPRVIHTECKDFRTTCKSSNNATWIISSVTASVTVAFMLMILLVCIVLRYKTQCMLFKFDFCWQSIKPRNELPEEINLRTENEDHIDEMHLYASITDFNATNSQSKFITCDLDDISENYIKVEQSNLNYRHDDSDADKTSFDDEYQYNISSLINEDSIPEIANIPNVFCSKPYTQV